MSRKTLKQKLTEAMAEIERLRKLATDCEFLGATVEDGMIEVSARPKHWLVKAMVASLMDTIGDAPNYVQSVIGGGEFPLFEVTVRRAESGKTPGQLVESLRTELESTRRERDDARGRVEELLTLLDQISTLVGDTLKKAGRPEATLHGNWGRVEAACKLIEAQHELIDSLASAIDVEAELQGFNPNEHDAYKRATAYLAETAN